MTITDEQKQALDALMALVPDKQQPQPDFFQTWLGVSGAEVKGQLLSLLLKKDQVEKRLLDWVEANPLDANLEFLGLCALAFYQVEKGNNPKIQTYIDALYYITTCASVGYADIFAATQPGRAIASLVMTVGPALTNMALVRPAKRTKQKA